MGSRKQLQNKVLYLNILLKLPSTYNTIRDGNYIINVGHIHLDHNSIYGGYQLRKTINKSGGCRNDIFGLSSWHRLQFKEINNFLDGLLQGIELGRNLRIF